MIESQIRQLLAGVSAEADLHLAEVEADLDQTRALLVEAIDRLGAAFLAVHHDVGAQQELLGERLWDADDVAAAELAALRERLAVNVSAAVTGLQFQDMVNQILERGQKRIAGVREALAALGAGADRLAAGIDLADAAHTLGGLHRTLADSSRRLDSSLRRQVAQKRLDSGEIELF